MGRRSSQMGSQKICLLMVVFFMYLYMLAAAPSTPLHNKAFSSDSLENIDQGNKHVTEHEHGTGTANVDHYAGSGIVESSKYAHGTSFGGARAGGGSSGFGEHGSNGGSGTPYVQGGTTVIPIYAGGAASNHHPNTHRNAGSRNQNSTGFLTLILTALAWFVHLYSG